jgi:hypothetical protein
MADGNVFSNSLYQLGQYLLNNPQGAGQQPTQAGGPQGLPGNMPQKIDTTWTYGAPTNAAAIPTNVAPPPPQQTTTPQAGAVPTTTESFAQPNLPGAQAAPTPQGVQQPSQGGGGGGGRPGAPASGPGSTTTGGFFGGGSQNPQNQQMGSALSGITSALSSGLSNAASAIGNVRTMPNIVQGGEVPGINQQAPTLVGRRPQTAFYG